MDVTCPRCQTDYEFDDALVSDRGTTVKCTNCGHQFRVFRPRAASGSTPELWRIERNDGEPLELRSLVELQRAIRAGRVSRTDLLRRGDGPARRVGDIPELEPFFPAPRPEGAPNTLPLPSVAERAGEKREDRPVAEAAVPSGARVPAPTPAYGGRPPSAPPPPMPPPPAAGAHGSGTLRPGGAPPPPRAASVPAPNPASIPPPARLPTPLGLAPPSEAPKLATPPPPRPPPARTRDAEVEPEPPTVRRSDTARPAAAASAPTAASTPPPKGDSYDSLFPPPKPARRGAFGFVAIAIVVGLGVAGATVGRPYLARWLADAPAPSTSASAGNDKLDRELAAGDRARTDGDWAGARDAFFRATTFDDKSLAAWDGLCTAESELAMAHWIAGLAGGSALERGQAATVGTAAGKSCARWSELARTGSDGPKKVSEDLRPVRALAAQGDGGGVRVYVPAHPGNPIVEALALLAGASKADAATQATAAKDAAQALGRADLATLEAPADLAFVAYGASVLGARPRVDAALAALAKRAPKYVLLDTLRALGGGATTDAGAHDAASAADAGAKVAATSAPIALAGSGNDTPAGDYRALNEKGHKALASGEPSKAEAFFKAALAQHPGDVDALYGLGQIARSRGDHAQAISYFKQVLDASPGFAPARLALADEQWSTGDKASAAKNYELYLERVSDGSGADRARDRLGKSKPEAPKPEAPKPEAPGPEAPAGEAP